MKLSTLALAAIVPATALGGSATATLPGVVDTDVPVATLEKRAVGGTVQVDGLRYRKCPRKSCEAVGQYAKGTRISLVCYTRDGTTSVEGDKGWGKLTNGYWVALAFGKYVTWDASLPYC